MEQLWASHKRLTGGPPSQVPSNFTQDCVVVTPVGVYKGTVQVEQLYGQLRERYYDILEQKATFTAFAGETVVEEGLMKISHSSKIEWLLPGLKGTDRDLSVPIMTRATFDQHGKCRHKSIWWDSASLLRQAGLLPGSIRVSGREVMIQVQPVGPVVDALAEMSGSAEAEVVEEIVTPAVAAPHVQTPKKQQVEMMMPMETVNIQVQLTPGMHKMAMEETVYEEPVVQKMPMPMPMPQGRMLAHSGSTLNDAPLSRSVSNTKIVEEPAQPNFRRQRSQFGRTEEVEESITAPGTIGSRPSTKVMRPPGGGSSIAFG